MSAIEKPLKIRRRLPIGAELQADGVHFRVWASLCQQVEVVFPEEDSTVSTLLLEKDGEGYFSGFSPGFR